MGSYHKPVPQKDWEASKLNVVLLPVEICSLKYLFWSVLFILAGISISLYINSTQSAHLPLGLQWMLEWKRNGFSLEETDGAMSWGKQLLPKKWEDKRGMAEGRQSFKHHRLLRDFVSPFPPFHLVSHLHWAAAAFKQDCLSTPVNQYGNAGKWSNSHAAVCLLSHCFCINPGCMVHMVQSHILRTLNLNLNVYIFFSYFWYNLLVTYVRNSGNF